jgi:hypothetical protein
LTVLQLTSTSLCFDGLGLKDIRNRKLRQIRFSGVLTHRVLFVAVTFLCILLGCFILCESGAFGQGIISELPPPGAPGLGKGAIIDEKKAVTERKEASSGAEAELQRKARQEVARAKLNQNALNWQLERAKAGSATAMRSIGMRFLTGDGLPKDEKQARDWLKKGADGGDSAAKKELAKLDAKDAKADATSASPKKDLEKTKVEK